MNTQIDPHLSSYEEEEFIYKKIINSRQGFSQTNALVEHLYSQ